MTVTEASVEKYLRKQAEAHSCLVFKFVSPAQRGVPDDIVIWPGGAVTFIELKTEKGNLSALQEHCLDLITSQGGICYVLRGKAGVDDFFAGKAKAWTV